MRSTFIDYSRRMNWLSTKTAPSPSPNYWGVQHRLAQRNSSALRNELGRIHALDNADDIRAQIGTQDLRDDDAAVGLLVILHDRDHHARRGEGAAV